MGKKKITYLKVGIVLWRRLIQDSSVAVGMCGSSEGNLQGMVLAVYLSFANNGNGTNCDVPPMASSEDVSHNYYCKWERSTLKTKELYLVPHRFKYKIKDHRYIIRLHNVSELLVTFFLVTTRYFYSRSWLVFFFLSFLIKNKKCFDLKRKKKL